MLKRVAVAFGLALFCGAAGFLGGLVAVLIMHVAPPPAYDTVLKAQKFVAIDKDRGTTTELTGNGLNLKDPSGRTRASLHFSYDENVILVLSDNRWDYRAALGYLGTDSDVPGAEADDWGLVINRPDNRRPVITIRTGDNGRLGFLSLGGKNGERYTAPPFQP